GAAQRHARHARPAGRGLPGPAAAGGRIMSTATYVADRERAYYARPGRPALVGAIVVGAFASAMTLWGTLAPISGAAIASGNLQVEGRRQSVQHPYGGVIRQLLVRDGVHVEKGQLLLVRDDS